MTGNKLAQASLCKCAEARHRLRMWKEWCMLYVWEGETEESQHLTIRSDYWDWRGPFYKWNQVFLLIISSPSAVESKNPRETIAKSALYSLYECPTAEIDSRLNS